MLTRIASDSSISGDEHLVISLIGDGVYVDVLRKAGVELTCLRIDDLPSLVSGLFRVARLLRRKNPDVIMTWLCHADLFGTISTLLARRGTSRLVWNIRCSEIDFSRYASSTRWIVSALSRLSGLPGVIAVNSLAGRRAHTALGYRPKSWTYLPNGVDLEEWRPVEKDRKRMRDALGIPGKATVFGMVARVDPQKNHDLLISVAERLFPKRPNLYLVLAGEGTDKLVLPKGLKERVLLTGLRSDIPILMRAFDFHVLSSSYGEGFPNVVCEAMASGVPCIVSDVGDAARIVGGSSLVIPAKNADALAEAMERLAGETPAQRESRGRAAREHIRENYDIRRVRKLYADLYRSVGGAV